MLRVSLFAAICVCFLGFSSVPALGKTTFMPAGIKVRQQWIVDQTNMTLREAPASHFIDNQEAFAKLWKAWRTDELPKVDFSKEIVLVLTAGENAGVSISAVLNEKGVLAISNISTQRVSRGRTYILAIVERNGINAVGKTPLPAVK